MLFRSLLPLSLLALAPSLISASTGPIQFTQPTAGTVWTAGQTVTVLWQPSSSSATLPTTAMPIQLVYGNSSALQDAGVLVNAPSEASGSVTFVLQSSIPQRDDYGLMADNSYSPTFTINSSAPSSSNVVISTPAKPLGSSASERAIGNVATVASLMMLALYVNL